MILTQFDFEFDPKSKFNRDSKRALFKEEMCICSEFQSGKQMILANRTQQKIGKLAEHLLVIIIYAFIVTCLLKD